MSTPIEQFSSYATVFGVALLSTQLLGCGWILGLDEYSLQESCPTAKCGVFVSLSGSDINEGTRELPVRTIARAIEIAQGANAIVQACAQEFQEAVVVPAGITLKGGLDCTNQWEDIGELAKTSITSAPDVTPLLLLGGEGVTRLEGVRVIATGAALPGGSSIAVIVDGATAEISRCDFTAGNGMAGEKGMTPADWVGPSDPTDPAIKGKNGIDACMGGPTGSAGGGGTTNDICNVSIGGNGGAGGIAAANGQPGLNGKPAGDLSKGQGGAGDSGAGCDPGTFGQAGAVGTPGDGAVADGAISASGYMGVAGETGGDGGPGQGGGGGGGAKGKMGCNGASAGGGGAGGCGGKGGLGGGAGGASIALISLSATIAFTDVTLKAGNGGAGGEGGDGQSGGLGGSGGTGGSAVAGINPGCDGGPGGFGGLGGKGGGGRGGHSLGIAFTGVAPTSPGKIIVGAGGLGGPGVNMTHDGAPGEAKETLEIPAATP
jgi:hypothetical protein